jgi:putative tricarboxylic transport membrane protein
MFEAAIEALGMVLDPGRLTFLLLGVSIGLVIGLLPGMGGIVGMSILLPFVFGMEPATGIGLLVGMIAVQHTADTFPSVLIGVPGSSGAQATVMDGYPLAKQGQARRALGAAFFSSMIGGLIGAVALFIALPLGRPLALALGSPELFMMTLLGLSMVALLAGSSPRLGLASVCLGLLLGSVGSAPTVAAYRYTFDSLYLYSGISIGVLALGLFAVPEMINLLVERRAVTETASLSGSYRTGIRDVIRHKWLVLRSAVLGVFVGFVPGLGGSVVDWIAYGAAKSSYRDNQNFGKGDIRGVVGPESANNAKEGGTLIPTLMFGIPGSGTTAILLSGLVLLGVEPGPRLVTEETSLVLSIVWTLAIANLVGAGACLMLSGRIARLSLIPASRLVPFLLVIMVVAAYQSTRSWQDILAFFAIGGLGYAMFRGGWPRPPLLIGFVLAPAAERYLTLSITRFGAEWLWRPGVIAIAVISLIILFGGQLLKRRSGVADVIDDDVDGPTPTVVGEEMKR